MYDQGGMSVQALSHHGNREEYVEERRGQSFDLDEKFTKRNPGDVLISTGTLPRWQKGNKF